MGIAGKAAMWGAGWAQNQLDALLPIYREGYDLAEDRLRSGYQRSDRYMKAYHNKFQDFTGEAMKRSNALLRKGMDVAGTQASRGYGQGIETLRDQYGAAANQMQQGVGAWQDYLQQANRGYGMYQNALGLGGKEGRASAEAAFQAGPGYQYSVDQAASQAQRAANRTGQTYGGNTQAAIARQSQNLANQEWGGWVNQLQGFQGAAQAGTQGYAGQLNQLGGLYQQQGKDIANLQVGRGKDLASIYGAGYGGMANNTFSGWNSLAQGATQYGQDQASLSTNYGNSTAGTALGYMGDVANATNNYYNTVQQLGQNAFAGQQQQKANQQSMMMGGIQMGAQLLGGMFGGGGGFLGGLFK
jgi:hypothetical protein